MIIWSTLSSIKLLQLKSNVFKFKFIYKSSKNLLKFFSPFILLFDKLKTSKDGNDGTNSHIVNKL